MRVLVIEDTADVGEGIVGAIERAGHVVDWARDGEHGQELALSSTYDLIVLDLMLPNLGGEDILRALRDRRSQSLVLVLTARSAVDERVHMLDLGADDYLCKPFDFSELEARIRSLLRRRSGDRTNYVSFGGIEFNRADRTVLVNGHSLALTRRELSLLEILLANRNRILSKSQLIDSLFGLESEPNENAIEVLVGRLRRKLQAAHASIHNHRGLGYQLRSE